MRRYKGNTLRYTDISSTSNAAVARWNLAPTFRSAAQCAAMWMARPSPDSAAPLPSLSSVCRNGTWLLFLQWYKYFIQNWSTMFEHWQVVRGNSTITSCICNFQITLCAVWGFHRLECEDCCWLAWDTMLPLRKVLFCGTCLFLLQDRWTIHVESVLGRKLHDITCHLQSQSHEDHKSDAESCPALSSCKYMLLHS